MDCQTVALRVLAHFVPGPKVLDFLAAEADWLDIRWCADDDSADSQAVFDQELPGADVIWHVLRPLSGADLSRGARLRLVQKFGAGVNTIDVDAATERGIAVANMPGAKLVDQPQLRRPRHGGAGKWMQHMPEDVGFG